MYLESLPEMFCLRDIMCFYVITRILKSQFGNEVKFGFIKMQAHVGIMMGKETGTLQGEICVLQPKIMGNMPVVA